MTTTDETGAEAEADGASPHVTPSRPEAAAAGTSGASRTTKARARGKKRATHVRGVCRECGDEADGPQATWCATHRPLVADGSPRARDTRATSDPVVAQLQANLETQLGLVAMMWQIRDDVCGAALAQSTPAIAEYWAGRARHSPAIARALESAMGAGGVLAGLAVHAPLMLAVMAHHVTPAINRRRQALADAQYEPAPLPAYPPGGVVIHDNATRPEGTAPDPAAEAAYAAAPVDDEAGARVWIQPAPGMTPPTFDPTAGDAALAWESAAVVHAEAAARGEPIGMATYDGQPPWESLPNGES